MNIIRALHGYFASLTHGFLIGVLEGADDVLSSFSEQITIKTRIYAITTAVGDEIDLWGSDLDMPRFEGESDADYQTRLSTALQGKGVTKSYLENIINIFLTFLNFTGVATIEEWFETFDLEKGWFQINLPMESNTGFWLDYSYLDYVSETRNRKECHIDYADASIRRLRIPDIRNLLNRWKAAGIQYKVLVEGDEYE
jgi:hypothetical protein